MTKETKIQVEISPGELLDKISILEIKSQRMESPQQLEHIRLELTQLTQVRDKCIDLNDELQTLYHKLKTINQHLWSLEDEIRLKEQSQTFDQVFINFARTIYRSNDQRALLKLQINSALGSKLIEEKSYENYI